MREWIAALGSSALEPVEVAELLLSGLLELPPDAFEQLIDAAVGAATTSADADRDAFREAVSRAMARFHVPQWMRLQDAFARAAERTGDLGPWR
jgi:hypothetical protein